jgi:HK97 family phage portal protein
LILSDGSAVSLQVDTLADRTPIFSDASYYAASAVSLAGVWAAYGALYKNQLWVNTVVRKLAFATARIPLDIKRHGEGTSQMPEPGPLADLLARPNERLDGFKLWLWTSATYDVYGEAFWLKLRDDSGRVRELHPMHPTNVIARRDPDTGEMFYVYSAGTRNVSMLPPIPEADVVPFAGYNPENLTRGLSNLEPLRQTLLNEDASRRATESWWQRGARPSVALKHPGTLSEGAQTRLLRKWESNHAGADLMGGTAILEEGMDAQIIQLSAEEMQYIESRKLNREEVCAAYDVPPPAVHILDRATFSNITENLRSMYRDTMAPRFALFESVISHHLVGDFDQSGDVFARFNMDEVIRGDFEVRAAAAQKLVTTGVMKPSEARPMFGLPDAGPKADKLYANAALQELGTPAERISITAAADASQADDQVVADAEEAMGDKPAEPPAPAPKATPPTRRGGRPPKRR